MVFCGEIVLGCLFSCRAIGWPWEQAPGVAPAPAVPAFWARGLQELSRLLGLYCIPALQQEFRRSIVLWRMRQCERLQSAL